MHGIRERLKASRSCLSEKTHDTHSLATAESPAAAHSKTPPSLPLSLCLAAPSVAAGKSRKEQEFSELASSVCVTRDGSSILAKRLLIAETKSWTFLLRPRIQSACRAGEEEASAEATPARQTPEEVALLEQGSKVHFSKGLHSASRFAASQARATALSSLRSQTEEEKLYKPVASRPRSVRGAALLCHASLLSCRNNRPSAREGDKENARKTHSEFEASRTQVPGIPAQRQRQKRLARRRLDSRPRLSPRATAASNSPLPKTLDTSAF